MINQEFFDNFFSSRNLQDVDLSLGSDLVSYTSSATFKTKRKRVESSVVVRRISDHEVFRKFEDRNTAYSDARFNPSGKKIAMIEKKGKLDYILIHNLTSGHEERIAVDSEVHALQWKDEDTLLFVMTDPLPKDVIERRRDGDDPIMFDEEEPFWSLYRYTPSDGVGKMTSGIQVWDFAVSGDLVVLVASDMPSESSWYESKLYSMDHSAEGMKLIYDPGKRQISRPRTSPDRKRVLLLESVLSDHEVYSGDVILVDIESGKAFDLTDGHERSYSDMAWGPGGKIYALWNRELTFGISVLQDEPATVWESTGTVHPIFAPQFSYSQDHFALVFSSAVDPQEVIIISPFNSSENVSSENTHLRESVITYPYEVVRWKADDGMEIYGLLRSLGPDKPLVVYVHGGPTSFSELTFLNRNNVYLDSGFSVFAPNYRGSVGKGRKYAEANVGDLGGKDFDDILSGINYLRSTGRLNSGNVFITGGSYGGFMSAWAVTQTDEFKASVSLFGISDWLSFHGTSNLHTWDKLHMNDDPYSHNLYEKFSPLNYVDRVKTPILLMHGEMDKYVPVGQYLQFYRALKDHGKETRLIIFPREGHGFSEKLHIETYLKTAVEWFSKHSS